MKAPGINELRTIGILQTNAPKILYGSGVVGAGRKDVYQDFKSMRGKFQKKTEQKQLGNGTVVQAVSWNYTTRFEEAVLHIIDLQCRFLINGKIYTVSGYDVEEVDKTRWFVFKLEQFGK